MTRKDREFEINKNLLDIDYQKWLTTFEIITIVLATAFIYLFFQPGSDNEKGFWLPLLVIGWSGFTFYVWEIKLKRIKERIKELEK